MRPSRPTWSNSLLACLVGLALGLTAAACGDEGSGGDDAGSTTTSTTTEADATSSTETTAGDTTTTQPAAASDTTEGAIARFEQYLHALGAGDIGTICEIAGPAAQRAEDQGLGPCETTFASVVDMISPEQAAALRSATVDPALVDATTPGQVHVPVEAVQASVTFTESDLGSYRLAYQDGSWYIVD